MHALVIALERKGRSKLVALQGIALKVKGRSKVAILWGVRRDGDQGIGRKERARECARMREWERKCKRDRYVD